MDCEDYFEDIKKLRKADPQLVEVGHDPMSERYQRAQMYLDILIDESECIGFYEKYLEAGKKLIEIITWLEPQNNRLFRNDYGSYAAFKTMYEINENEAFCPQYSELFAYYDGEPTAADKKNKPFKDLSEAIGEMESYDKYSLCM